MRNGQHLSYSDFDLETHAMPCSLGFEVFRIREYGVWIKGNQRVGQQALGDETGSLNERMPIPLQ